MPFDDIVAESVRRTQDLYQQDLSDEQVAAYVGRRLELQYDDDGFGRGAGAVAFIVGYSKSVYYNADGVAATQYGLLTDEGMEYALANGLTIVEIDETDPRIAL